MPSFYCCSLNCWFFFFTGIEKGILAPFLLVFPPFAVFVLLPALLTQLCSSCSCYCSVLLPEWGAILKIQVSGENSSYLLTSTCDGGEMKMGMEEARDLFFSAVQFQLCCCDLRIGFCGWVRDDGRQICSIQLLPFNISGWKTDLTFAPLLIFLSGAGSISQSVSLMTSEGVLAKS